MYLQNKDENIEITETDLEGLVDNSFYFTRIAVAHKGYGLEKLINDKHWGFVEKLPVKGYGLDVLINDEDTRVRAAVAKQDYGLEKLKKDPDEKVREIAVNYKKEVGYE